MSNTGQSVSLSHDLESLLDKLYGLHPKLIDLSLTRVTRFLSELGNPHLKLPPVIHVAGTNGKGSTIAFMKAIAEAHSLKVHVATSPHLVHINERIVLAGHEITDQALITLIEECMDANKGQDITFFEMIMAITFLAFARTPADLVLLETGMGGRYDATNVIPNPAATVITVISHDHKEFLGDDITGITGEKCGIMKPGVPCVITRQPDTPEREIILQEIQSHALSTGAPLHLFGTDWASETKKGRMRFKADSIEYDLPAPSLLGTHQIHNAGAAIEALRVSQVLRLDPEKISTGLGQVSWPARLQRIENTAFSGINLDGWQIFLDGGHNDSAGEILAQQCERWKADTGQAVHLVIGMLERKDAVAFVRPMTSCLSSITTIPVPHEPSSLSPDALAEKIKSAYDGPVYTAQSHEIALNERTQNAEKPGVILIAGSLYLAGHILAAFKIP